jgi:hypothetical protein
MPKHSEERQAAELAKLLREIARDLEAGILATDLPAPFKKARDLATALDRGHKATRGVYAADDPAVQFFKKRFGVDMTGAPFVGDSFNPMPPDPQSARVRAVNALLWRFQECAKRNQKAEADDLAKFLTLADILDGGKDNGIPKAVALDSDVDKRQARARGKIKWLAEAMTLVQERGKLISDATIARLVHRDPSTLSRNETYQRAAKSAREGLNITKGSKDRDGNLEAESE